MPKGLRRVVPTVALVGLGIATAASGSGGLIRVAGQPRPALLELVDTEVPPIALAVAPDGRHVAGSYPDPKKPKRSILRLYASYRDEPLVVELPGIARSVLFAPDGLELYVVLYRPAKKRLGDAELLRVDVEDGKTRNVMQLPATSSALDFWPARQSLLVSALNEIRTIRIAGMRSGPLFRITGLNLAVTALAGSTAVLVGQEDEILLVDLDDRSGEDGMPVRERLPVPAPVQTLAAMPDGKAALARLSDGSIYRISFGPLAIEDAGSALGLVALSKDEISPGIAMAPLPTSEEAEEPDPSAQLAASAAATPTPPTSASETPPEVAEAPSESSPESVRVEETPGAEEFPTEATPIVVTAAEPPAPEEDRPEPTQAESPPPSELASAAPIPLGPSWPANAPPQVWGRLSGDGVDEVQEIILLGPNNILREATRLRPESGGYWHADNLEPGRYQVQLSAGGNKVLVTEPRIAIVDVSASGSVEATTFRVLRAYVP